MLHQSLLDLAAQAPRCGQTAVARGVLAESHELLRNALAHRTPEPELATWYSTLVADILRSPVAVGLTGGARVLPTGEVGRGDAAPASVVTWLTVTPAAGEGDPTAPLRELVASAGLPVAPVPAGWSPAPEDVWRERVEFALAAGDADSLAVFVDAGLPGVSGPLPVLLERAVSRRPPRLRSLDGLPDRAMPVDVPADLLAPVADLARWASLAAGAAVSQTPERLTAGRASGFLSGGEADALRQAWETGLSLWFRRWADRVEGQPAQLDDLTALDRSAYGAAARMIAAVIRSLAVRHGIALSDT